MGGILQEKKDILQIRQEMARIRRLGGRPLTNYYNQCEHCAQPLMFWGGEKSCAFMWEDNGVPRVFFYTIDKEELVSLLALTDPECSIDFITKEKEECADLFMRAGYQRKFEYGRFIMGEKSESAIEMNAILKSDNNICKDLYHAHMVRPAKVEEAEEVDACLRKKFDPYEAHFYDMDTLREYIKRKWVWIVKENNTIIAAYTFEIKGKKFYAAFLFNDGPVNVFTSLLNTVNAYIANFGYVKSYCWMSLTNKRILRYNLTYNGFKFDGLYDMIYVKS